MHTKSIFKTDVLVIGGGMAGCFAAIKAREKGAAVILVDKGYVSSSGQTPFANSFLVFSPEWGHNFDAWMDQISRVGDYLNNRQWAEIVLRDSYARYMDLLDYGAEFVKNPDGSLKSSGEGKLGPCVALFPDQHIFPKELRKKALSVGVKIMDRIMVTDILKKDGRANGAIGMTVSNAELCVFKAKSVIICTGAASFKPVGWPISNLTADGDMMAYRAGAEITGKEFIDTHCTDPAMPAYIGPQFLKRPAGGVPPPPVFFNMEGDCIEGISVFHLAPEFEVHAGKGPVSSNLPHGRVDVVAGASAGMSTHKSEGIWPVGTNGAVGVDGLYAAGDSLGIMLCGAAYSAIGLSLCGSAVTGTIAGEAAAVEALGLHETDVDEVMISQLEKEIFNPLMRKGGFSPSWVIQLLQNTMIPYYTMIIKKKDRLEAALTSVVFFRDHLVPKMKAGDAHQLRLAIEAKNMVCNAEMKIRASLFREESRGTHYREDFPTRDDEKWHAWIKIKDVQGEMVLTKELAPAEWGKPKNVDYLNRFPIFPPPM